MDAYSEGPPGCCEAFRAVRGHEGCSTERSLRCVDIIALLVIIVLQILTFVLPNPVNSLRNRMHWKGSTLNYFLINRMEGTGSGWYFWFLADFIVLLVMMSAVFVSGRHQTQQRLLARKNSRTPAVRRLPSQQQQRHEDSEKPWLVPSGALQGCLGLYPLCYISWLLYSVLLSAKVALLIEMDITSTIPSEAWYGSQFLTLVIGCAALVFALLVDTHHDAPINSEQQTFIIFVTAYTTMEILDAVSLLSLLFPGPCEPPHDSKLNKVVLALTCVNFVLPTLCIYKLAQCDFGSKERPLGTKLLCRLLYLFAINGPFLAIRMYLWTRFNTDVSIFLLKNIILCYSHVRSFIPESAELIKRLRDIPDELVGDDQRRPFDALPDTQPPAVPERQTAAVRGGGLAHSIEMPTHPVIPTSKSPASKLPTPINEQKTNPPP